MGQIGLEALLNLERTKRAEAEEAATFARKEMNAAIVRAKSVDGVIGKLLERVKVPAHLAEHMKELDAGDRLDFLLGHSGFDWTPGSMTKFQPKTDEAKAARAAGPRSYQAN